MSAQIITATLDTTCIIDLAEDQPLEFREAMQALLSYAEEGRIEIAVTTRVQSEAKHQPTVAAYARLIEGGRIGVIPSTVRLGHTKLGSDVLVDEARFSAIAQAVFPHRNPGDFLKPGEKKVKGFIDLDHLYGHDLARRDFFVTRDGKDVLNAKGNLQRLGIAVRSPAEIVEELSKTTQP